MKTRILLIALVFLFLLDTGLCAWILWNTDASTYASFFQRVGDWVELAFGDGTGELSASGVVEAREVAVAAEVGGRAVRVYVDEGDRVVEGDILLELDVSLLATQIAQAEAGVILAQARLTQLEEGARPEEIRRAQATLTLAGVTRDGYQQALLDARAARDNPQELDAQIDAARSRLEVAELAVSQAETAWKDTVAIRNNAQELEARIIVARTQVEVARHQVEQTTAQAKGAERQKDFLGAFPSSPEYDVAVHRWWAAEEALNIARAQLEGAERALANLVATKRNPLELNAQMNAAEARYRIALAERDGAQGALESLLTTRANPQALEARVNAAQAQYETAIAAAEEAQAALELVRAGATAHELEMAGAQVEQAEGVLAGLEVQRDKLTIRSPMAGIITSKTVDHGETVAPGGILFTVSDLDEVTLTVYIPEDDFGLVHLGQEARVTVDSYPRRAFLGEVRFISSTAEFTPRNVQTKKERVHMVFAVKVRLPNLDHALKPGMPADALLEID
jgi:multidrug efflux pump subunit AcrA (membrane-fusion protein)